MTNAEAAQAIARALGPVLPICYVEDGACTCGGRYDLDSKTMVPHVGKELGKAPVSALVRNGVDDATTNSATIDRWYRQHPRAGVALSLKPSRVVFIDPDSSEALAEAQREGVAGGMLRSSRNDGFLFKRPADWPVISITKGADGTDLEIRTTGYAVVWNTHQDGSAVRVDLSTRLGDAPAWAGERLKQKAAAKAAQDAARATRRAERAESGVGDEPPVRGLPERALRRWRGELVVEKNGKTDRSDSLYFIALDLAEHGASEAAVEAALRERDVALGWEKYTHRDDADDRYREAAERAVAWVVEREKGPKLRITSKTAPADDQAEDELAQLRREVEELRESNRDLLGWIDRLATLEEDRKTVINAQRAELEEKTAYISLVTEVLAKPNEEMSSTQKVVFLVLAYETHYRASRGRSNLPLIALAERTGLSKNTCSMASRSLAERPGSPFERTVTRELRRDEEGLEQWVTTIDFRPRTERTEETLRAGIALPKAPDKPKHGGSPQATEARWRRCPQHRDDDVVMHGVCSSCGLVVGEKRMTAQEWAILNHQVCDPEERSSPVTVVPSTHNMRDSDGPGELNHQDVDPALHPVSLLDYAASRPQEPPERCPASGCTALGFSQKPDGSWRCLKSAHDPRAFEQFTPSAEWQDLPDGYACPPGVEWRTNLTTGTSQVRWPEMAAVSGGSE
jgi:hypothetical protein